MTRIFWTALCVALFACVYSFPLRADDDQCVPKVEHLAKVRASPAYVDHRMLESDALQRLIQRGKATNGDTDAYDTGYLVWTSRLVALFLGNDGKICVQYIWTINYLRELLEVAEGRPA